MKIRNNEEENQRTSQRIETLKERLKETGHI